MHDQKSSFKDGMSITHLGDEIYTEWDDGSFIYLLNDRLHRKDGPALYFKSGYMKWYIHGSLHRTDGPACVYESGQVFWHLYGKSMTFGEWCLEVAASDALKTKLIIEYNLGKI